MTLINSARELRVYQKAYENAMEIYQLSKVFPPYEKYDLVSQIRRSSRSVAANIIEAWRRRRYPKNFISKLNDSETEADETIFWLDIAKDCKYIQEEKHKELVDNYDHILSMLVNMIYRPEKWKM